MGTQEEIARIQGQLNESVFDHGYKVDGSHFDIGSKIHTSDYYYAKRFFQKLDNSLLISKLLLKKLKELKLPLRDTTLIGYGSYSRLFLNETCNMVNAKDKSNGGDKSINYAVLENNEKDYTFLFEPDIKTNIVIILSITCTFSSYFTIREFISNNYPTSTKINITFISIFLIKDKRLGDGLINSPINPIDVIEAYQSFNWESFNSAQSKITLMKGTEDAICYYLIDLQSHIYLSEKCPMCHPELDDQNPSAIEYPLFPTHTNHDTPNFIFGSPKFSSGETPEHIGITDFKSVINLNNHLNPYVNGYMQADNSKYLHYIKTDTFYKKNKPLIIHYFSEKLNTLLKGSKGEKPIVFITPIHLRSSTFLEDLIVQEPLKGRQVVILPYQPSVEFVENFVFFYSKTLAEAGHVFYFDDFITSGDTFKLISDYLKHARGSQGKKENPDNVNGFDALLTFVDSTTTLTKNEILRKLLYSEGPAAREKFIPFFQLNVPQADSVYFGNPVERRRKTLKSILSDCHLDALKEIVSTEIRKLNIRTLEDVENTYSGKELKYFPFGYSDSAISCYYPHFNFQRLNLIRLQVFNDLAEGYVDSPQKEGHYLFLHELIKKLTSQEKLDEYFDLGNKAGRDTAREIKLIKDIINKTLCRSPFKNYKGVYEAIFEYNRKSLLKLNRLSAQAMSQSEQQLIGSFEQFRRFKFHIRRSVELNSNFLTSKVFLKTLKSNFKNDNYYVRKYDVDMHILTEQVGKRLAEKLPINDLQVRILNIEYRRNQVKSYRYFLLNCYKELIIRNPSRAFRLELLLSSAEMLPEVVKNTTDNDLEKLISDPYYQLSRILRTENIFHLNQFKEFHLKNHDVDDNKAELKKSVEFLKRKYLIDELNETVNFNARKFLSLSTNELDESGLPNEANSLISMLKTSALLKNHTKGKHQADKKRNDEGGFRNEVKEILRMVCDIMEPDLKSGNELSFSLFMKYREPETVLETDHVFTILSDDRANLDDGKLIKLDPNGLVFNMLNGLQDQRDGNVQTFIAVAKEGDNIHAFQQEYIKYSRHSREKDFRKDQLQNIANKVEEGMQGNKGVVIVKDALAKDCLKGKTGLKMISDAKMVLLFRLATVDQFDPEYRLNGEGVMVICSNELVNAENFINFIKVEKLRLLLLIKEQLIEYLQKEFRSAAFIEVLETRKNIILKRSIEHGVREYFEAMNHLIDKIDKLKLKQGQETALNDAIRILRFVRKTIQCHFLSINQIDTKGTYYRKSKRHHSSELRELFLIIRVVPYLASNEIKLTEMELDIPDFEFYCPDIIFDLIIPELIVNMRKYALNFPGRKFFKITRYQDSLVFINSFDPRFHEDSAGKKFGGIDMCNRILTENLYLRELKFDKKNQMHSTYLPLPKQQNEPT
nr:hypothetical protein [uncultured Mucilaginibacter sp.]